MSKDNVLEFFTKAAQDEKLLAKLNETSTHDELVAHANEVGYEFSSEHVDEALTELQQKTGFFGALTEAVFKLFSPTHDDYPATGVQPYSGDPNPNP